MSPFDRQWSVADAITLACTLEAAAAKVGNVHPGHSFPQTHFGHFASSAIAIRACFESPAESVGQLVLRTVQATIDQVGSNTNLGMLLLFAPLAIAIEKSDRAVVDDVRRRVREVLSSLTSADAEAVYEAIRLANPGGLGERDEADVQSTTALTLGLREAMQQVASFDAVARQYTNGFADIFQRLLPWLATQLTISQTPVEAIERLHLHWLAYEPDGLIIRKAGQTVAEQAQKLAKQAVQQLDNLPAKPTDFRSPIASLPAVVELDRFLRADGNRRNPGTTADLIAATLFVRLVCCC